MTCDVDPGWVSLSIQRHIGGKTLKALLAHFGSVQAILQADAAALRRVRGVGPRIAASITHIDPNAIERALADWLARDVRVIPSPCQDFPAPLKQLDDPPPTLFVRGGWSQRWWDSAVAIVGTRQPSPQARTQAMQIGAELAGQGYTVVSGLALGVDSAAHAGALATGRTVAVLGNGVLNPYPAENRPLAATIMHQGALICECAPDAEANAPRLVSRNRIISGLVGALIVIETAVDGGAMYAARAALSLGRPVYAVDRPASGNRALIADGAIPLAPDATHIVLSS